MTNLPETTWTPIVDGHDRRKREPVSPLERVAAAICEAEYGFADGWENQLPAARAAIEKMRDPTEAMIDMGCAAWVDLYPAYDGEKPKPTAGAVASALFTAMIDAALREAT